MILQGRPQVLDTIPQALLPGIEKMSYDFYAEQPIKSKSSEPPGSPPVFSLTYTLPLIPFVLVNIHRRTHLLPPRHHA